MELREDTLSIFHKHKIPLINAFERALPSCKFDITICREERSDKLLFTVITIKINDKLVNMGFDTEFDAILYFRGMVLMKDFLSSCTEQELLTSILNSSS